MRNLFVSLRNTVISGFFFLMPVLVVLIIITKARAWLAAVGKEVGIESMVGIGGSSVATGVLLIGLCLVCGLLMRYSLIAAFGRSMERTLAKYVPAYNTYKIMAEEKLKNQRRILPYTSALIKRHDCWQPAYIIERDQNENYVVFLPDIPETSAGHVLLARGDQIKIVSSVKASELDASLKKWGKGLLSELRLQDR